ncbi:TrbC/VirB2 family protein [Niallia taxi]|uniref:TrbC/VirB2 family protein n=1 Tax=Niallia taxi TaxID=2499688 RepID=UPI00398239F9
MKLKETIIQNLAYNDIFDNVSTSLDTFTGKLQGIGLGVIIACLAVIGVMFMFGEGPGRTAKKWLLYIIAGGFILFGAATLGSTIQDTAGF